VRIGFGDYPRLRFGIVTGKLARGSTALVLVTIFVAAGWLAPQTAHADTTSCPTPTVGGFTAGPSSAPVASCLLSIGDDTDNGHNPPEAGVAVTVSNLANLGGLATDGSTVYLLNGSSGQIVTTPLAALPTPSMTSGTTASATGTLHSVDWSGIGGFGSLGATMLLSLAYSHGCLFVTNSDQSESGSQSQGSAPLPDTDTAAIFSAGIHLYCIDTSTWSVSQVAVPTGCLMPLGHYYTTSSLIEFPDGRIGKVSEYMSNAGQYISASDGGYTSVLRTYTVSGEGSSASIACSTDYAMHDNEDFGNDEHGIATDGTYLYRIQWWQAELPHYDHNYNSWKLSSSSVPDPTYRGFFAMPFGNMHYLTYDPSRNDYLVGSYAGNQFYVTPQADPGPGPGNPLTPQFSATLTSTTDGYTVQIDNYDSSFSWGGTATNGGTVTISNTGLVTVTGLSRGQSSTVTVTTSASGVPDGSSSTVGSALPATVPDAATAVSAVAGNARATVSWTAPAQDGGAAIESYTVTASDTTNSARGGQSFTTPDGSTTKATLTGLTNGDSYTFDVAATNSVGTGPASAASSAVTPRVPPAPSPSPSPSPSDTPSPSSTPASTPSASPAPVGAPSPTPVPLPVDTDSSSLAVSTHTPASGSALTLTAMGFKPGTAVQFWIHSHPTFLGTAVADSAGTATLAVKLNPALDKLHYVQAVGLGTHGEARNLAQTITISVTAPGATLPFTGTDVFAFVVAALSCIVVGVICLAVAGTRRP
jgi:Fibronectin type III domain